ncbi:hypothetical protein [Chamaesiphon sp. VAR_69_metabat_338]|uniref:hypothetical protein n=1 Tax=Chamaesiphon sp. VAR_69_metabat_338 TaxID=2964704 RepID=UPI00286D7FDB|nr:hypothetical protein [Chamaesiphon sp. VAR_69_metabat_338]
MSFRQTNNRHDIWQDYCDDHAKMLSAIGLPMYVFKNERSLAEFLTTGITGDNETRLDRLNDDRFWLLFGFADSWFCAGTERFTAMEARRIRDWLHNT